MANDLYAWLAAAQPLLDADVDHSMKEMVDESFGPVVGGMKVRDSEGAVRLGDDPVPYHPGYVQSPDGVLAGVDHTGSQPVLGAHGFPTSDTLEVGDLRLGVTPVAFAPVLLDDGAGRVSRFPRALCRFHDPATGRRGAGWTEWNQPQAAAAP